MSSKPNYIVVDGNTAVSNIAFKLNEIAVIYPITPSSPMAENFENLTLKGSGNIFGTCPTIQQMQSEGGAAGALHGALVGGVLATTFTSSQGLMLMLAEMCKIAGEMLPTVIYVASRSLAFQSLSIFGDHSDVMFARGTGFAFLCANNVQEAQDFAVISQTSTLSSSVPFLNFFDGFRTSHEIQKIEKIEDDVLQKMINKDDILKFRNRALNSYNPVARVGAQNSDVYFQGRESTNLYYDRLPSVVQKNFDKFAKLTGRKYEIFEYVGNPEAEILFVSMGSSCDTVEQRLENTNNKAGLIKVRLFHSFDSQYFLSKIPSSCQKIIVLDKTKEAGSQGEPLYMEVVFALKNLERKIETFGGRYGLGGKEFNLQMVESIFNNFSGNKYSKNIKSGVFSTKINNSFTVGINDDVSFTSVGNIENTFGASFEKEVSSLRDGGLNKNNTFGTSFEEVCNEFETNKSSVLSDISFQKETKKEYFDFQENEKYIEENGLITDGICLPYHPDAKKKATKLRKNMTKSEKKIRYDLLKNREEQRNRQKPIDHFIADFFCSKYNLIIEIDGDIHNSESAKEYDKRRTEILELYGLKVIRFKNDEVLNDLEIVENKLNKFICLLGKKNSKNNELNKNNTFGASFEKEVSSLRDGGLNKNNTFGASFEEDGLKKNIKSVLFSIKIRGMGGDGMVGISKNIINIIGENTKNFVQGYFEYDGKKANGTTISHLRISPKNIKSRFLIQSPNFVVVSHFEYVHRYDVLKGIEHGGVVIFNSSLPREYFFSHLNKKTQLTILDKNLEVYVVDASGLAKQFGLGNKISTVFQSLIFQIIAQDELSLSVNLDIQNIIKQQIKRIFKKKGEEVIKKNIEIVDFVFNISNDYFSKNTNAKYSKNIKSGVFYKIDLSQFDNLNIDNIRSFEKPIIPSHKMNEYGNISQDFLDKVIIPCLKLEGDKIPVSMMSFDGTIPTGSSQFDTKIGYDEIPVRNSKTCIDCTFCSFVCPHNAIFSKQIAPHITSNYSEEENNSKYSDLLNLTNMILKHNIQVGDIKVPYSLKEKESLSSDNKEKKTIYSKVDFPGTVENAKKNRKNMTKSEKIFWEVVRKKQIEDTKRRKQYPIGNYIADFFCNELSLIVEIDGSIHNKKEQKIKDKEKDTFLLKNGFFILRYKNDDLSDIEIVENELLCIINILKDVFVDDGKGLLSRFVRKPVKSSPLQGEDLGGGEYVYFSIQVNPEQCTGCGLCVDNCPMKNSALTMKSRKEVDIEKEQSNFQIFESLPGTKVGYGPGSIQNSQLSQSYFLYSGACAGCGETPVLKLLTQIFGPNLVVANATGCSSIYGGTFPNIPWTVDKKGNGPAWANSLFEDNAEFGFGIHLANKLKNSIGKIASPQQSSDVLWIIGGDGWAYDIGFGGLDHIVSTGENLNILILDTQGYSNTGGQCSKSTPQDAKATFSKKGKTTKSKDLGKMFMTYENVYVASINLGANNFQAMQALQEAVDYDGPSVVIAYSTCISHGIDMSKGNQIAKDSVSSGFRPLYRYNPNLKKQGKEPLIYDGPKNIEEEKLKKFKGNQKRF